MSPIDERDDERDDLLELADLPREVEPPAGLEERLVAELRERGLVAPSPAARPTHGGGRWRQQAVLAAALLLAALGGWFAKGWLQPAPPSPVAAREYLLLLAEPNGLDTTKSIPELVDEYRRWALSLRAEGRLVASRRLLDGSRRLSRDEPAGASSVADPLAEATGFFLIRADSAEEAMALAADSPHLAYGGEISVREIARDG